MTGSLHERARRIREKALVRAWEYRQRNYSKGVWHRLRRLLVEAGQAWIIDEAEADRLEASGRAPYPVGSELEPPKRIFVIRGEDLPHIHGRRQIPVRLSSELLQARSLALLPHRAAGAVLPPAAAPLSAD